jgi:maltooligosyltrehalose trehalohydrolase
MHTFKVWAPFAQKIAVELDGSRNPMQGPDDHGWWHAGVESARLGDDYGFLVDDDPKPYPDPRSQWQPAGVHGLSRVYDQSAFLWTDMDYQAPTWASAIIYELHIGTFTSEGTLAAAVEKLQYLKQLGITHVELMPVASFAGNHGWGYDGVSLFAVHEPYGGPDALKCFVDAAHRENLAVLLDVVYNHFGPAGNYIGRFGPYITEEHHTAWGGAVNLEGFNAYEVRRYFCDNALMWMRDFHMDGLRLDAVHALIDRSAIHFLEQLALETTALEAASGRQLVLIAESDSNDPRLVSAREAGGLGLDAQWSDDFHHALFAVLAHEPQKGYYTDFGSIKQFAKAVQDTFVYDGVYSKYRKRVHGKSAIHLPQSRFLGYIQNHDQIGNRAIGDRITEITGFDRAKIAAAFVLLAPFIPMLFQGEEWAASSPFQYFAAHDDPELARLVSEGRRREFVAFGWDPTSIPDPEKRETFDRSKLLWDEVHSGQHAEMLAWYRDLIMLRNSLPDLNMCEPSHALVQWDEDHRWITMQRGCIQLICNLNSATLTYPVLGEQEVALSSHKTVTKNDNTIELPPNTVTVLRLNRAVMV